MNEAERIAALEAVVRNLVRRVSDLEGTSSGTASAEASPSVSSPRPDSAAPPLHAAAEVSPTQSPTVEFPALAPDSPAGLSRDNRRVTVPQPGSTLDLEALIGRYGTLALATVTILAAVGSFLAWSIAHGLLGPWSRIFLGTLAAILLAVAGKRFRVRGARQFGNVLLALALAAMHVVAWAMGPELALVPALAALAVAALASASLCIFAIHEADDELLAVGFGGAYLAPFVSGSAVESPDALFAGYGAVVFAAGIIATNAREFRSAFRVVSGGMVLFALTLLNAPDVAGYPSPLAPFFALTSSLTVLVVGRRVAKRELLRTTLTACVLVTLAIAFRNSHTTPARNWAELLAIVIASFILWSSIFAFPLDPADNRVTWMPPSRLAVFDDAGLPLLLLLAAISVLPPDTRVQSASLCALWAVVTGWLAHRNRNSDSFDFFAAATSIEMIAVPLALWSNRPDLSIPALAAVAASLGYGATIYRPRVPLTAGVAVSVLAFMWSLANLARLEPYASHPFSTLPSVSVASAVAAAFLIVRLNSLRLPKPALVMPWILAFLWVAEELGRAFSPDASAFLLVAYLAASGAAVLSYGTKRAIPRLRQVGLALAVLAGLKALFEAQDAQNILARVGIYLVAGAYLMLVAYRYRRAQPGARSTDVSL